MNLKYRFEKEEYNDNDTFSLYFKEDPNYRRTGFHLQLDLNTLLLKGEYVGDGMYFTIKSDEFRNRSSGFTMLVEEVIYNISRYEV